MSIKKNFPNHSLPPLFDRATLCSIAHCWSPLAVFLCGLWVLATATVHCIIVRFPTDMNVSCICILSPYNFLSLTFCICVSCGYSKQPQLSTVSSPRSPRQVSHFTAGALKPHFLPHFLLKASSLSTIQRYSHCHHHHHVVANLVFIPKIY